MDAVDLELRGLKLLSPKIFGDERGYFFESYRQPLYAQAGISEIFVQDNVSFSRKDSVRGLHYQEKPGQAKLVSCLQGTIWDVAVDIRPGSETFGKWAGGMCHFVPPLQGRPPGTVLHSPPARPPSP